MEVLAVIGKTYTFRKHLKRCGMVWNDVVKGYVIENPSEKQIASIEDACYGEKVEIKEFSRSDIIKEEELLGFAYEHDAKETYYYPYY